MRSVWRNPSHAAIPMQLGRIVIVPWLRSEKQDRWAVLRAGRGFTGWRPLATWEIGLGAETVELPPTIRPKATATGSARRSPCETTPSSATRTWRVMY